MKRLQTNFEVFCSRKIQFYYNLFSLNQEDSTRKCQVLGMRLALPINDRENTKLVEFSQNLKHKCTDSPTPTKIWLNAKKKSIQTNYSIIVDEDNNVVKYRPNAYNLFDKNSKCIHMYLHGRVGWFDSLCDFPNCFVCMSIKPSNLFRLRGLKTYIKDFDAKFTKIINENGKLSFKGYKSLYISCKNLQFENGTTIDEWNLQNIWEDKTVASLQRNCFDPPVGFHEWYESFGSKHIKLSLSTCKPGQFSCRDGSCISINKRCDLLSDCQDNFDEEDCTKVLISENYISTLPPSSNVPNEALKISIEVKLLRITNIDSLQSQITTDSIFILRWYDKRITYKSLQKHLDLNIINPNQIWKPQISVENALMSHYKEEGEKIRVRKLSKPMKDDPREAKAGKVFFKLRQYIGLKFDEIPANL